MIFHIQATLLICGGMSAMSSLSNIFEWVSVTLEILMITVLQNVCAHSKQVKKQSGINF